jgi:hypothetical protein
LDLVLSFFPLLFPSGSSSLSFLPRGLTSWSCKSQYLLEFSPLLFPSPSSLSFLPLLPSWYCE